MKSKKTFLLTSTALASIGALGLALIPHSELFKTYANTQYSCDLPNEFVEIDEVIGGALSAGATPTTNTFKFRATVTRRAGDVAYVQRVNQTDKYAYGLRVVGCNAYASELAVGNVVDFSNGRVFLSQGVPTFELTSTADVSIAFKLNDKGYSPITYQTLADALTEIGVTSYYDDNDFVQTYSYSSNKLVTINNLVPNGGGSVWSLDEEGRESYSFSGHSLSNSLDVLVPGDIGFSTANASAMNQNKYLNLTGYLQIYDANGYRFTYLSVVSSGDVEIGSSYIDETTITSVKSSKYVFNDYYQFPFAIYNINGHGDVPYVEFANFYNNACTLALFNGYQVNKYDDGNHEFYYYNQNIQYFEFYVNSETDEISVSYDPYGFAFLEYADDNGLEVIANGSPESYVEVNYDNTQEYGSVIYPSFDLSKYGLDIVEDRNNIVYVPLQAMNTIFNDLCIGYTARYNGKNLYYWGNSEVYSFYTESPWYDEEWDFTVSSEYAEYNYSCLCLTLEKAYGLWDYYYGGTYASADALIKNAGFETDLKSTNTVTYESALIEFFNKYIYDGHADYTNISAVNMRSNTDWGSIYGSSIDENARYHQIVDNYYELQDARNDTGLSRGLTFEDDTAILRFDAFIKYDGYFEEYDVNFENVTSQTEIDSKDIDLTQYDYETVYRNGTDLMFRKAFDEIYDHGGINNVVLDLSLNTGGANNSLIMMEAYLTGDPVHTSYNRNNGVTTEVHYNIDINYDGTKGGVDDTYEGVYDFYLITSPVSFSCGNYFPTVIKDKGAAILIGEKSGGGTCPVGKFSDAYGMLANNSSNHQLGTWDSVNNRFVNNEVGIEVDYAFSRVYFYNDAQIVSFIHNI